jgi:hypothetical protein
MPTRSQFSPLVVRYHHTQAYLLSYYILDAIVTLLPLPSLSPPTVLAKAKTAMSFGIHTSVQKPQVEEAPVAEDPAPAPAPALPPSVITRLVIGCKRRVVVYTWVDGEAQEPKVGR